MMGSGAFRKIGKCIVSKLNEIFGTFLEHYPVTHPLKRKKQRGLLHLDLNMVVV
jgi:hypothetical protein